jgi:hypothetical protein
MTMMADPSYWADRDKLIGYLAKQLLDGRLALLLGAGVSIKFGLPGWAELVNRMSAATGGAALGAGGDALRRAQTIRDEKFKDNTKGFIELVREALYRDASVEFSRLTKNELLSAIGSLVMASGRGSASKVITLNFDDILETYLEYFGFVVSSVIEEKHWNSNSDVTIYHPHGFLPFSHLDKRRGADIVLSTRDFLRAMTADRLNGWRWLLFTLFRTHTVLHIGLSGDDLNIESLMNDIQALHPAKSSKAAYGGVRFALDQADLDTDIVASYKGYGVYTHLLKDWDEELPNFLFGICQEARKQRLARDTA